MSKPTRKRGSCLETQGGSPPNTPRSSKMPRNMSQISSYNRWADEVEATQKLLENNTYSQLSDDEELFDAQSTPHVATKATKNSDNNTEKLPKIPPINLIKVKYEDLSRILAELNIKDYEIRFTTIGIRILVKSRPSYALLKVTLQEKKIEHYSYEFQDEKPVKLVLSGLPKYDTSELEKLLKDKGVDGITDVKIMTIRKFKYEVEHMYLIYFSKKNFDLKFIKQIKAINNIIVHWDFYNKRTGPTQCRRCQMFGHGTKSCNVNPRCVICGAGHLTTECPHPKPDFKNNQQAPEYVRCVNCNQNHQANYPGCKSLQDYKSIRNSINQRNRRIKSSRNNVDFSSNEYPSLPRNQPAPGNSFVNSRQSYPTSYASVLKCPTLENKFSNNSNSQNLFSFQEITSLVEEVVEGLENCKTRKEQFNVITSLAIKYVYSHGDTN